MASASFVTKTRDFKAHKFVAKDSEHITAEEGGVGGHALGGGSGASASRAHAPAQKEKKGKKHRNSLGALLEQLLRQRNLAIFTVISALQVFECTFEKNFLSIFVDVLLADFSRQVRASMRAYIYMQEVCTSC